MRLTAHILDQVSWWEHTTERDDYSRGFNSVFTLHFKQWWRPRKVIRIAAHYDRTEGCTRIFQPSSSADALLSQLNTYLSYPGS